MNTLPLGMNGLEPINPKKKKNSYSHRSKKTFSKILFLRYFSFPYILTHQLICKIIKYPSFGCWGKKKKNMQSQLRSWIWCCWIKVLVFSGLNCGQFIIRKFGFLSFPSFLSDQTERQYNPLMDIIRIGFFLADFLSI